MNYDLNINTNLDAVYVAARYYTAYIITASNNLVL